MRPTYHSNRVFKLFSHDNYFEIRDFFTGVLVFASCEIRDFFMGVLVFASCEIRDFFMGVLVFASCA